MYGIQISRSVAAWKIELVTGKSEGKSNKIGSLHTHCLLLERVSSCCWCSPVLLWMISIKHGFKGEIFQTVTKEITGRKHFPSICKVGGRHGCAYSTTCFNKSSWWFSLNSEMIPLYTGKSYISRACESLLCLTASFGSTDHPEVNKFYPCQIPLLIFKMIF